MTPSGTLGLHDTKRTHANTHKAIRLATKEIVGLVIHIYELFILGLRVVIIIDMFE